MFWICFENVAVGITWRNFWKNCLLSRRRQFSWNLGYGTIRVCYKRWCWSPDSCSSWNFIFCKLNCIKTFVWEKVFFRLISKDHAVLRKCWPQCTNGHRQIRFQERVYQAYSHYSNLIYDEEIFLSKRGIQQGDPLLVIQIFVSESWKWHIRWLQN